MHKNLVHLTHINLIHKRYTKITLTGYERRSRKQRKENREDGVSEFGLDRVSLSEILELEPKVWKSLDVVGLGFLVERK